MVLVFWPRSFGVEVGALLFLAGSQERATWQLMRWSCIMNCSRGPCAWAKAKPLRRPWKKRWRRFHREVFWHLPERPVWLHKRHLQQSAALLGVQLSCPQGGRGDAQDSLRLVGGGQNWLLSGDKGGISGWWSNSFLPSVSLTYWIPRALCFF